MASDGVWCGVLFHEEVRHQLRCVRVTKHDKQNLDLVGTASETSWSLSVFFFLQQGITTRSRSLSTSSHASGATPSLSCLDGGRGVRQVQGPLSTKRRVRRRNEIGTVLSTPSASRSWRSPRVQGVRS